MSSQGRTRDLPLLDAFIRVIATADMLLLTPALIFKINH